MKPASDDIPAPSVWRAMVRGRRAAMGVVALVVVLLVTMCSLPWMLGSDASDPTPRYNTGVLAEARLAPSWWGGGGEPVMDVSGGGEARSAGGSGSGWVFRAMGTDGLGRSLLYRCMVGGAISLTVGLAAALISVVIGTAYGAIAGLAGGRIDSLMMRAVDVLYGLPYILLVVLLAVAVDAGVERVVVARVIRLETERAVWVEGEMAKAPAERAGDIAIKERLQREAIAKFGTGELSRGAQSAINIVTLLAAIGSVSWLTMARVVRGEVLSLKSRPFVEAGRALGVPPVRILRRHILPNLVGPIIVYATLTVPQAILQESFLSFLGIGIRPPLPSWGNLAAEGLSEINPYKSNWWLLLFPCLLLAGTLVSLNVVGDGLRDAMDPKSRNRRA